MIENINLNLTTAEFDELLTLINIGEYVRNGVFDSNGEYDNDIHTALTQKLFAMALQSEVPGFKMNTIEGENFVTHDTEREEKEQAIIEEFNEDEFWNTLTTRLSHRDFFNNITPEDQAALEETGWMPESLERYTKRYETEFENYGLERLVLDENVPLPSDFLIDNE